MLTIEKVNHLIRNRRSVFPNIMIDKEVSDDIILELLTNANWAPNHRHTEPWRFKIFKGNAKQRLGQFLADQYKLSSTAENFKQFKYDKTIKKAGQAGCIIAICMQRDPQKRVPEFEEIAAVACAVQNLWLSLEPHGLGGYWSTPKSIQNFGKFMDLNPEEQCLGFFYLGYYQDIELKGQRGDIADKITWQYD